jgi:hypothetical protein
MTQPQHKPDDGLGCASALRAGVELPTEGPTPLICGGCGDEIPDGTPPHPADMNGTGRLCVPCHRTIRVAPGDDLVACAACPGAPLFYASEMDEHRSIAHQDGGAGGGA